MARPYKPLKQRPNGVWFVQIKDHSGKRLTRSLETTDPIKATARASQALEELKAMAMGQTPQRWRADEPGVVWDIPTKADGSNDYDNAVAKTVTWGEIADPEQIKELDWYDLMREADKRRKRRTGTGYSEGWRKNIENSIKTCPFGPMEATPRRIRDWVDELQTEKGFKGKTIETRVGSLSSLFGACIKSGLLSGHTNPFTQVDYRSEQDSHLYTAVESDYRGLFRYAQTWPYVQSLALRLQAYMGCRVSEIFITKDQFNPEEGTITTGVKLRRGEQQRVIPIPDHLVEELKVFDWSWCKSGVLNKRLKEINKQLSTHSWRHGWKDISRDVGMDPVKAEFLLGHQIGRSTGSLMESVYGKGYSIKSLKEDGANLVWDVLDQWSKEENG